MDAGRRRYVIRVRSSNERNARVENTCITILTFCRLVIIIVVVVGVQRYTPTSYAFGRQVSPFVWRKIFVRFFLSLPVSSFLFYFRNSQFGSLSRTGGNNLKVARVVAAVDDFNRVWRVGHTRARIEGRGCDGGGEENSSGRMTVSFWTVQNLDTLQNVFLNCLVDGGEALCTRNGVHKMSPRKSLYLFTLSLYLYHTLFHSLISRAGGIKRATVCPNLEPFGRRCRCRSRPGNRVYMIVVLVQDDYFDVDQVEPWKMCENRF